MADQLGDEKSLMMFSRFDTTPACDGRTDGQTFCDSVGRAMHIRRAVKSKML